MPDVGAIRRQLIRLQYNYSRRLLTRSCPQRKAFIGLHSKHTRALLWFIDKRSNSPSKSTICLAPVSDEIWPTFFFVSCTHIFSVATIIWNLNRPVNWSAAEILAANYVPVHPVHTLHYPSHAWNVIRKQTAQLQLLSTPKTTHGPLAAQHTVDLKAAGD